MATLRGSLGVYVLTLRASAGVAPEEKQAPRKALSLVAALPHAEDVIRDANVRLQVSLCCTRNWVAATAVRHSNTRCLSSANPPACLSGGGAATAATAGWRAACLVYTLQQYAQVVV